MEEKMAFGGFIARKRKEKGLTQRELAEQLYVTESAVSKWERGLSYQDITLVGGFAGGWMVFWDKALPITLFAVTLPWIYLLVIRYIRVNGFFKTSLCLTATGLYLGVINSVIAMILDGAQFRLLPVDLGDWSQTYINGNTIMLCVLAFLAVAAVFAAAGVVKELRENGGK